MARRTDAAAGRQRLLGLAAVGTLSAATALAFGRVFIGRAPTWELVAAALASVGIAVAFERRGLVLATVASLVGLAFAVTWIVLPQTALYGLPSLRTLRAIGRSLEFVGQQARVRVAPTPPLPPLLLAALTAVWTAAFSIHALAIRAGSPLLAVLPAVALVGFADTVLDDGARPVYAIVFLGAALAVVFADGLRRIRQWGPVWAGPRSRRLGGSVKGSRPVAAAVIVAAVLIPGVLPGFRSAALVDLSTDGDAGIGIDPFVSILAQLDEQTATDLFSVDTGEKDEAAYWRLYALDQFDGSTWTSSDPDGSLNAVRLAPPTPLTGFDPIPPAAERLSQRFTILTDIAQPWLPMAHPAEALTLPGVDAFLWDPVLQQAFAQGGMHEGFQYTVTSRIMVPTPKQLDKASVGISALSGYERFTTVPPEVDPGVKQIAERWTRGADTAYRKILAIQQRFHDGSFLYTTDIDPETGDDADALLSFLTTTRQGFCQQYATAMAILVRELGYPARVAVGYRPGTLRGGAFVVQSKDAHAWVEVHFPGYGWLPFEPTPGHGTHPNAQLGTYLNPGRPGSDGGAGAGAASGNIRGGAGGVCTGGGRIWGQLCNADIAGQRIGGGGLPAGVTGSPTSPPGYSVPYRWIFLGLVLVLAALMLVVPIAKSLWRRRALHRPKEPRERVLAAYRVFDGQAADLGLGRQDGETLEEHRARLSAAMALSDGHLGGLTSAAIRAAYAHEAPTGDEARSAARDARTAIRELRREAGLIRRIVGTYRPGL